MEVFTFLFKCLTNPFHYYYLLERCSSILKKRFAIFDVTTQKTKILIISLAILSRQNIDYTQWPVIFPRIICLLNITIITCKKGRHWLQDEKLAIYLSYKFRKKSLIDFSFTYISICCLQSAIVWKYFNLT